MSIKGMRVEKAEVPWSELCFDSKAQNHQTYDAWVRKVLATPEVSARMVKVGVEKALIFQVSIDH